MVHDMDVVTLNCGQFPFDQYLTFLSLTYKNYQLLSQIGKEEKFLTYFSLTFFNLAQKIYCLLIISKL